ncbi:hypothetical protein [Synechococcus sp. UW140]|uniref:hypothetical protein n=1 Tax=Synechococcus sp. UW140 TaxID=368503 RepID=UPI0031377375
MGRHERRGMVSGGVEPVRDFLYTNPAAACAKDQCLMKYLTSGNVQIEFFDAFNKRTKPLKLRSALADNQLAPVIALLKRFKLL